MLGRHADRESSDRISLLRGLPLFAGLSHSDLQRVDAIGTELDVPPGKRLMTQGETGREALVILSGTADVVIDGVQKATVGPGEVLGEMALLEHQPRVATVTAQTPMRLLVLDHAQFSDLLTDPRVAQAIAEAARQRRATSTH